MLVAKQKNPFGFYKDGSKHDSPNAGHPITAMALALGIKLGGDTSYFGKVKKKADFGEGRESLEASDVEKALRLI
jgi:adenosylcobinamide-phosphate synthase